MLTEKRFSLVCLILAVSVLLRSNYVNILVPFALFTTFSIDVSMCMIGRSQTCLALSLNLNKSPDSEYVAYRLYEVCNLKCQPHLEHNVEVVLKFCRSSQGSLNLC